MFLFSDMLRGIHFKAVERKLFCECLARNPVALYSITEGSANGNEGTQRTLLPLTCCILGEGVRHSHLPWRRPCHWLFGWHPVLTRSRRKIVSMQILSNISRCLHCPCIHFSTLAIQFPSYIQNTNGYRKHRGHFLNP